MHVGVASRVLSRERGWPLTVSAGALWRPWSWLSLAATVDTLTSAPTDVSSDVTFRPRWGGGIALRPIAGSSRFTISADWRWNSGYPDFSTRIGVAGTLTDGLDLALQFTRAISEDASTGARQVERVGLMLRLGFGSLGVDVAVRGDESHNADFGGEGEGGLQLGVRWSEDAPPSLTSVGQVAVVVPLSAKLNQGGPRSGRFMRLLLRLREVANNPVTKLVVFRSDGATWTWSQVDEMQRAIGRLHAAGKKTAWYKHWHTRLRGGHRLRKDRDACGRLAASGGDRR